MRIGTNGNFKGINKKQKVKINLDEKVYLILCRYVLQSSSFVRLEHLVNLRRLISIIDKSAYENNPNIIKMVNFIEKGLDARINCNLTDLNMILTHINGGLTFKVDFLDYDNLMMNVNEIEWCHNMISEALRYNFIDYYLGNLQDIITRFKTTEYGNRGEIVREFEECLDQMKNGFRKVKIETNINDVTFSLKEGSFETAITDTYNVITSPSRRLLCGMQGLNELTGGGFEAGRVYMFLGTAGVGKSIMMLNLIYQMKLYNSSYKVKDPTKIPCIVLLTMENTVVETITRIFDMVIEDSHGMKNYSLNDVIRLLKSEGQLTLTESSPIDIIIKYKPNKSVDTSYLSTLYDNLSDEGYEPICLFQDHVKRIRSIDRNPDLRVELGDIVNELKVFAADKQIPVITVSHLNRDATKILEDASRKGNQDNGRLLGRSNIGESLLMTDNLDCAFILTKDYDQYGRCFMTINRVKMRDKGSKMSYIAQPFCAGGEIRLVEDLYGPAMYKESIHGIVDPSTQNGKAVSGSSALTGNQIVKEIVDEDDNFFEDRVINILSENDDNDVELNSLTKGTDISGEMNNIMNQLGLEPVKVQPIDFNIEFRKLPESPIIFYDKVG